MIDVDLIRPVKTTQINDDFEAHIKRGAFTPGLDYNCAVGEPVWAADNGVVIAAGQNPNCGAGKNVTIKHRDNSQTIYFHLSEVIVHVGQHVKQSEPIGKTGNTGTQTTGPHLHFAIKDNHGNFVDPEKVFAKEKKEKVKERKAKLVGMVPTHGVIPD